MEDSGHSQELQNPNMELKAYLLDWRLKDRDGKDLDNFEDVVPRVDKADVPQESNSFSSNRGVIGEPITTFTPKLYMFMMELIATSTLKLSQNTP